MTTFNDPIGDELVDELREANSELSVEIVDLTRQCDFWRTRAERAQVALRLTLDSFESYENDMAELRRQVEYSQQLLDGAVTAMERLT